MDLAINGGGFFQVTDGNNPATVHAQRPVQGRPRRLHRQQPAAAPDGLPGRRHRRDPARRRRARCSCPPPASTRRRRRAIDIEMNLDSRVGDHARRRPAPQIDFTDPTTYNNATSLTVYDAQGPGRGADLLLPEVGHRHLERVRHRQRHARSAATAAATRRRSTTMTFPANGGAPTAPVGADHARHPGIDQRRRRRDAADPRRPARPDRRHAVRRRLRRDRPVAGRLSRRAS